MKRITTLFLSLLCLAGSASAQLMDITLRDQSVVSYKVSDIESISFSEEPAPGQIHGKWYLGYRAYSSGTNIHYDGTECLDFKGNKLNWKTPSSETDYTITYSEDMRTFTLDNGERQDDYSIILHEVDLLVIRHSTTLRYLYKSPEAAHNAEFEAYPNRIPYTDINKILNMKSGSSKSTKTPMGSHFENRHVTNETDIAYLSDPTQQPTIQVESFTRWNAKTVKLYPFDDPKPADINQHAIGDCCLCAVLASYAYIYPDFIKSIVHMESASHFIIDMYDPQGKPVQVAVDNKILCDNNGNIAQLTGKNNAVTWATLIEKAIMKWESVYQCNGIGGIGTEHVAPLLSGCGDSFAMSPGKLFPSELKLLADWAIDNGMISVGGFNKGDLLCGTLNTVTGHAFSVMKTTQPDDYLFSMRNPWGITSCDGVLEIPNRQYITKTIDFRLVYPGAAEAFKREMGGYVVPKFAPKKTDLGISPALLQQYGLQSYGPAEDLPEGPDMDE